MTTDAASAPPEERLLYRAEVTVGLGGGPDKVATLPAGEAPVVMGAHGALAEHLGVDAERFPPRSSTIDYVVAAAAACLTGTFARALGARGIAVTPEELQTRAIGDIVLDGKVPVLRRVVVHYTLSGHADRREDIERVLAVHHRGCAVSRTLEGSVAISTELELLDGSPSPVPSPVDGDHRPA